MTQEGNVSIITDLKARALEIAREAIAQKKDADGAIHTAALTREGRMDDSHEVQDALRGARAALRAALPDILEATKERMRELRDKHSSPTGDAYACGAWDQAQRLIGALDRLAQEAGQ